MSACVTINTNCSSASCLASIFVIAGTLRVKSCAVTDAQHNAEESRRLKH